MCTDTPADVLRGLEERGVLDAIESPGNDGREAWQGFYLAYPFEAADALDVLAEVGHPAWAKVDDWTAVLVAELCEYQRERAADRSMAEGAWRE